MERWVIVAPERAKRPSDYRSTEDGAEGIHPADCPFCPGNEHMPPGEETRYLRGVGETASAE